MLSQHFVIHIHIFISACFSFFHISTTYLLFSNNTVLQLTASISVPVVDLAPNRKINWDWGLQMNYNLPYNLASFYNVPIWPKNKRNIENEHARRFDRGSAKYWENFGSNETVTTSTDDGSRHRFDFTAGELYRSLERLLESHSYHSSCLLQSVCELAKHPFDIKHNHVITELITFTLTPSWHLGFSASEELQGAVYEVAEKSGTLGLNCKMLYPFCNKSLLELITHVIFDND
ncbi:uncharacterized protein [Eurosta solidaginis]|uniref:uncharacterized protein n=1 Tax=Eurosta solidaginis TaxID=178769 RepID=UPI003530FF8B